MNIKKLVKPNVLKLKAYNAKEIPCKIKLDANESPYSAFSVQSPHSPQRTRLSAGATRRGERSAFSVEKIFQTLNRYPDPEAKTLKGIIAKNIKLKPDNILLGNGSDELIYYLITTFGGPVLYPVPTFSMYGIISQALGEKGIAIKLDNEFDLNPDKILTAIKKLKPKLIFLSSPNNPTGNCFSSDKILKIIEISKGIVVVDEAYQPFSSERGFLPLLRDYKNLVIMRTLSKIGLAGLRVGFLIADAGIIKEVNKVRLPFNVNLLSQAIAAKALKNKRMMGRYISTIVSERERFFDELSEIKGIKPYPTEANFILFKVNNSDKAYDRLLKKGVLVRNMRGVVDGCLRVTVGTPEENTAFLKALREIL